MKRPEEAFRSWTSRAGTVKVRNVLNPLLWTIALVFPTSVVAVYLLRDDAILKLVFAALGGAPVLVTLITYIILLFLDPDRLQSEEYQLRHHALQILYRKDATAEIVDIVNEMPRLEIERKQGKDEQ